MSADEEDGMSENISAEQFEESDGVQDWRVVEDGAGAFFRTASFADSAKLVRLVSELPGVNEHPPKVDVRHDGVSFRLITTSDKWYGMTTRDVELARQISGVARTIGLQADPTAVQSVLVIPGATDITKVVPFWRAMLGYEPRADSPDEDLVDPRRRGPSFWFEKLDEPHPSAGGGSTHLPSSWSYQQAEAPNQPARAAGGHMVRDEFAPSWWTLADSAGKPYPRL